MAPAILTPESAMSSIANDLPGDILILVFQVLQDDYISLFRCALVNRAFNQAASKFLYRRVVLAPHYPLVPVSAPIPEISNLGSATLPQNAKSVEIIEITGYLPLQPPPIDTLSTTILDAFIKFENLREAILVPTTFHDDIFTNVLKFLALPPSQENTTCATSPAPPRLRELVVNTSCTDGEHAPLLTQITGLEKLSIYSPTRAVLDLLPEWLRKLSHSLTELHMRENCGSVTPGVLKHLVPLLEGNIRSMSLGLSYSLTDEDVYAFLHQLQKLEWVELRYYWQLRPPVSRPSLTRLRCFTACHANFQRRSEVRSLCKWIRRAISTSPLESLCILQDQNDDDTETSSNTGANISFRSIIDHLCCRHSRTLRVLDMRNAYIDVKSLRKLFGTCNSLEEVYLCAGSHALTILKKHSASLQKLHTASFDIRNIRLSRRRIIDMELVTAIMKHGPPLLRRLSVNGQTWESTWKRTKEGTFAISIHKQRKLVFPWDREPESEYHRQPEKKPPVVVESVLKSDTVTTRMPGTTSIMDSGPSASSRLRVRFSETS